MWKSRWPVWAPVPQAYGFCGRKAALDDASLHDPTFSTNDVLTNVAVGWVVVSPCGYLDAGLSCLTDGPACLYTTGPWLGSSAAALPTINTTDMEGRKLHWPCHAVKVSD